MNFIEAKFRFQIYDKIANKLFFSIFVQRNPVDAWDFLCFMLNEQNFGFQQHMKMKYKYRTKEL